MKEEEKRNDKKGSLFPSLISMEENKMVETVSLGPMDLQSTKFGRIWRETMVLKKI